MAAALASLGAQAVSAASQLLRQSGFDGLARALDDALSGNAHCAASSRERVLALTHVKVEWPVGSDLGLLSCQSVVVAVILPSAPLDRFRWLSSNPLHQTLQNVAHAAQALEAQGASVCIVGRRAQHESFLRRVLHLYGLADRVRVAFDDGDDLYGCLGLLELPLVPAALVPGALLAPRLPLLRRAYRYGVHLAGPLKYRRGAIAVFRNYELRELRLGRSAGFDSPVPEIDAAALAPVVAAALAPPASSSAPSSPAAPAQPAPLRRAGPDAGKAPAAAEAPAGAPRPPKAPAAATEAETPAPAEEKGAEGEPGPAAAPKAGAGPAGEAPKKGKHKKGKGPKGSAQQPA
eukprot:tig00020921_g15922.t1